MTFRCTRFFFEISFSTSNPRFSSVPEQQKAAFHKQRTPVQDASLFVSRSLVEDVGRSPNHGFRLSFPFNDFLVSEVVCTHPPYVSTLRNVAVLVVAVTVARHSALELSLFLALSTLSLSISLSFCVHIPLFYFSLRNTKKLHVLLKSFSWQAETHVPCHVPRHVARR